MENLIQDIDLLDRNSEEAQEVKTSKEENTGKQKKLYIESYGCQMNFADSEIVTSIMKENGYDTTSDFANADVVFLNTCSIREKAEQTVRNRLNHFNSIVMQLVPQQVEHQLFLGQVLRHKVLQVLLQQLILIELQLQIIHQTHLYQIVLVQFY